MPIDLGILDNLPLLNTLPQALKELVVSNSSTKEISANSLVCNLHDIPSHLTIVLKGQLQKTEITKEGRITGLGFVRLGDAIDWLSVIDEGRIDYSVHALQNSTLLLTPLSIAKQLLNSHPPLSNYVLRELAAHIRKATIHRQLLTLPNAYHRVFLQITHLVEQNESSGAVNLPKQHEIAAMANTSRETVSRAIQLLLKDGILVKDGHRFKLLRADALQRIAKREPDER